MTDDLKARADAYLALAKAASKGPWLVGEPNDHSSGSVGIALGGFEDWIIADMCYGTPENQPANAAFIAASHEAASIIEAQRAEIDRLRARIDSLMLEHCPDEMTKEQMAEWASSQRVAVTFFDSAQRQMIVCPTCGYKRCPKATDNNLACTGSNEPGQAGSAYK